MRLGNSSRFVGRACLCVVAALGLPAVHAELLTGSHTGNGADNRPIGALGFQPDVVIIKGDAALSSVIRTSTMSGDAAKALTGSTGLTANLIQSLSPTGFVLGNGAQVNSNAISYHWIAFKAVSGEMKVGSYTGNGSSSQAVTQVGFSPEVVFVLPAGASEATFGSSASSSEFNFGNAAGNASLISSLDADGFTVGGDSRVNSSGTTYHYVAWNEVSGAMDVGTYAGNGVDDRNITGVGFRPEYVMVRNLGTEFAMQCPASAGTDNSMMFAATPRGPDRIQLLQSDGFQVGRKEEVNRNGDAYQYMAWKRAAPATQVRLVFFGAERQEDGTTLLRWRTAQEIENLGFHVYHEESGAIQRVTPTLVTGSALSFGAGRGPAAGHSYRFRDPDGTRGQRGRYWLEDVDLRGRRTRHGPVAAVRGGARPAGLVGGAGRLPPHGARRPFDPEAHDPAAQRSEAERAALEAEGGQAEAAATTGTARREAALPAAVPAGVSRRARAPEPAAERLAAQWALAAGKSLKVLVGEEGWYRVPRTDLLREGLSPGADPRLLQLFVDGQEVPFVVAGGEQHPGSGWDAIEFYGLGLESPFTALRAYWLIEGSRPGRRIGTLPGRPRGAGPRSFPLSVERRDRLTYFAALRNGDEENFFGALLGGEPLQEVLSLHHVDPEPPGEAELLVKLQGVTHEPHRVRVLVNDLPCGMVEYEGQVTGEGRFALGHGVLREGENTVTLAALGGETDVSLVDSIQVTYWHLHEADGDMLRFTAEGGTQVTVEGFSSPSIRVLDVTRPDAVHAVRGKVLPRERGFAIAAAVPGRGTRTLLALAESRGALPAAVRGNRPSAWQAPQEGADLLIVAPGALLDAARPLAELRQAQGLGVALIDVDDVYDEFSHGAKDPRALKELLRRASAVWERPPRFVLLLGDASFDPRDYLGGGDRDLVPTRLVDTAFLETASDDWFADLDGDEAPDLAMGRIPVQNREEAEAVIAKLVSHEVGGGGASSSNEALFLADRNDAFDFEALTRSLEALLPAWVTPEEFFLGQADPVAAQAALIASLNRGQLLVNYVGHGSVESWTSDVLFTSDSALELKNGPRLPAVIVMSCLSGFFHDLYTESMAEALLKAPGGGARAVWASSGLTSPAHQLPMNEAVLRLVFEPEGTLGEATLRAKAATTDADVRRTWILFGDPSAPLR